MFSCFKMPREKLGLLRVLPMLEDEALTYMEIDRFRLQVEFHFIGQTVILNFAFILMQYELSGIAFLQENMSESGF